MSYKSNESKRRFKRKLKRAKLKAIENKKDIATWLTVAVIFGTMGGFVYADSRAETPNIYMGEKIEVDGEEYWQDNLFLLTNEDETHLCNLERREKQFYTVEKLRISGDYKINRPFSKKIIYDPWVYVDVKTRDELSIRGHEELFGYDVVPITEQLSFDDTDGEMVYEKTYHYKKFEMTKDQYEQLVNNDGKSKTLVYMSK